MKGRLYKALETSGVTVEEDGGWFWFDKTTISDKLKVDTTPLNMNKEYSDVNYRYVDGIYADFLRRYKRVPTQAEMDRAIDLLKTTPNLDASKPPKL